MKQQFTLSCVLFTFSWSNSFGDSSFPSSSPSTRLTLPQGHITGISIFTDSSKRVNAYLGIPYSLPPIGDLRFAPPERHPGWNRTLFAGHFRPDCPQLRKGPQTESDITNEDCLYLNIFVPEMAATYRNYPVIIFIHGIDYVEGSPLIVNAEDLAKEGIIVVTFSYRLNVFGFFSFEDEYARGNLGLLDQYMAFMWVKDNIQYFGGLSSNVTLMGHGSGASSILIHMTSPRTKNLFHKVVLMSGSLFSPWLKSYSRSENHPTLLTSKAIAKSLGCYGKNYMGQKSSSVLICLRQKATEEILKAFESAYKNGNWSNSLSPISDDFLPPGNQYLPLDPLEAIKVGKYHKVPIMTGITKNEGTLTLNNWKELIGQNDDSIQHFIRNTAINHILEKYQLQDPEIKNLVIWNYLEKIPKSRKLILQLLKLYNDAMYTAPFWYQIRMLSKNNGETPIFVYFFTQPSPDYLGNYVELLNLTESSHGSELLFFFSPSLFQKMAGRRMTNSEERLSVKIKRLLTYFLRMGNPTLSSYGYSVWNPYDSDEENYLKLYIDVDTGQDLQTLYGNPSREAYTFWNSLLPEMHEISTKKAKKLEELLVLSGASNNIGDFGVCSSYKSAMFTTLAFLILSLVMLVLSLVFLKKRTKQRDQCIL